MAISYAQAKLAGEIEEIARQREALITGSLTNKANETTMEDLFFADHQKEPKLFDVWISPEGHKYACSANALGEIERTLMAPIIKSGEIRTPPLHGQLIKKDDGSLERVIGCVYGTPYTEKVSVCDEDGKLSVLRTEQAHEPVLNAPCHAHGGVVPPVQPIETLADVPVTFMDRARAKNKVLVHYAITFGDCLNHFFMADFEESVRIAKTLLPEPKHDHRWPNGYTEKDFV